MVLPTSFFPHKGLPSQDLLHPKATACDLTPSRPPRQKRSLFNDSVDTFIYFCVERLRVDYHLTDPRKTPWKRVSVLVQQHMGLLYSQKAIREHYFGVLVPHNQSPLSKNEWSFLYEKLLKGEHYWARYAKGSILVNRRESDIKNLAHFALARGVLAMSLEASYEKFKTRYLKCKPNIDWDQRLLPFKTASFKQVAQALQPPGYDAEKYILIDIDGQSSETSSSPHLPLKLRDHKGGKSKSANTHPCAKESGFIDIDGDDSATGTTGPLDKKATQETPTRAPSPLSHQVWLFHDQQAPRKNPVMGELASHRPVYPLKDHDRQIPQSPPRTLLLDCKEKESRVFKKRTRAPTSLQPPTQRLCERRSPPPPFSADAFYPVDPLPLFTATSAPTNDRWLPQLDLPSLAPTTPLSTLAMLDDPWS